MTGLSKITDKILDDARREAAAIIAEADAECTRISGEYKEKTDAIAAAATAEAKTRAEEIVLRTRSGESSIKKNLILKIQGDMIDRAFEIAEKELVELALGDKLELLTGLLTAVLSAEWEAEQSRAEIYGDEADEDKRIYEVMLNQKDRERHGDALINNFKCRIVGKDMGDLPSRVILCDKTADIEGGLIVKVGSVEINSSIKAIIAQLRPMLEGQVAKILFP